MFGPTRPEATCIFIMLYFSVGYTLLSKGRQVVVLAIIVECVMAQQLLPVSIQHVGISKI